MSDFAVHFFFCNIFAAVLIGFLFAVKKILKNHLSGQSQYHLWFFLLFTLAVPFLPLPFRGFLQLFSWLHGISASSFLPVPGESPAMSIITDTAMETLNDFAISVKSSAMSAPAYIFLFLWIAGMLLMLLFAIKARLRFFRITQSALPLQNEKVRKLFNSCRLEAGIRRKIPVCSTAFLKSPIITGCFRPRIYLPIHLISDYQEDALRYMLLHELMHYKHKDALANGIMNLAGIVYWFHPLVWLALREMRNDREIACDSAVLEMLSEKEYEAYGTTLINFAEKISLHPFPFFTAMGGDMKQMRKRILNIAGYRTQTLSAKIKGVLVYTLTALLVLGITPAFAASAPSASRDSFQKEGKHIVSPDLSSYFSGYEGSFVLYDEGNDIWQIYNMDAASTRISPDSTYKIYDALIGLEEGVISPADSYMEWDGKTYPFASWNTSQNLFTAMKNSVNWYFQSIDKKVTAPTVKEYIHTIGYGNQDVSSSFPSYWLEASLKISPLEQAELLQKFYHNEFSFRQENIETVKQSLLLFSQGGTSLYGKTGTGNVDGRNIQGWFVGFAVKNGRPFYFAVNIREGENAAGSTASEIALSILRDMDIL